MKDHRTSAAPCSTTTPSAGTYQRSFDFAAIVLLRRSVASNCPVGQRVVLIRPLGFPEVPEEIYELARRLKEMEH